MMHGKGFFLCIWGIGLISHNSFAGDDASITKQIGQLNNQIQGQFQQTNELVNKQMKDLNTKVQAQLKKMNDDLNAQMQKANTLNQEQLAKVRTELMDNMKQLQGQMAHMQQSSDARPDAGAAKEAK